MERPMHDQPSPTSDKWIFISQVASVSLIWVMVVGIVVWVINLILLSLELHDVPGASVGISIVALPVFITLAGVLTYVFVGLQKGKRRSNTLEGD